MNKRCVKLVRWFVQVLFNVLGYANFAFAIQLFDGLEKFFSCWKTTQYQNYLFYPQQFRSIKNANKTE
jgi:hypothetical protein